MRHPQSTPRNLTTGVVVTALLLGGLVTAAATRPMTAAAADRPSATAARVKSPAAGSSVASVRVERASSRSAYTTTMTAFASDGSKIAVETMRVDAKSHAVDLTYTYLLEGRWKRHTVHNAHDPRLAKVRGDAFDEAFRRRRVEIHEAKLAAAGDGTSEGPIACGIAVAGATAACGGLAGVPFAGWAACGLAVAAATCECFEEEIGC